MRVSDGADHGVVLADRLSGGDGARRQLVSRRHLRARPEVEAREDLPEGHGLAQDQKKPLFKDLLLKHVFFDTCVYHQPGIDLLLKVVPNENILFASEMVGAVRGIDPESGHHYDDTKRYIDANTTLSAADKQKIFRDNIKHVYPRFKI